MTAAALPYTDDDVYIAARITEEVASRFAANANELHEGRLAAARAIGCYAPRNGGEMVHAARIVALSMMELDLLRAAALPDMDPLMKMRLANCAMNLEKAACVSERLLRLRQQPPKRAAARAVEPPEPASCALDDQAADAQAPQAMAPHEPPAAQADRADPPPQAAMGRRAPTDAYPGGITPRTRTAGSDLGRFVAAQGAEMGRDLIRPEACVCDDPTANAWLAEAHNPQ